MKKNNIYSGFADYYDIYARQFDYNTWFKYLKKISGISEFKNKKVLDLGCGTGTLLLKFAKEGANVTGVDLSDEMLSITDQKLFKAKAKALLIHKDISKFISTDQYVFIYSTCDTVNYLNEENFESLLKHISLMLRKDGIFTFDILNKVYFEKITDEDIFDINEIKYIFDREIVGDQLLTEVTICDDFFMLKEKHTQYFIEPDLIKKLANRYDLEVDGVWDIFTQQLHNSTSDKLQILIRKT